MTVSRQMQNYPAKADIEEAAPLLPGREGFFKEAVNSSQVAYLITDPNQPDNPVVYVNQAFLTMTGYSADEVIGRNCRFLQGPETDATAINCLRQAMARHKDVCVELVNYRKDGAPFWNEVNISPVFNDAQELTHFFAAQKDITRRRTAEEALSQAHKMKALGDLTGGIAHDFNNLLQVINGHLDVIQRCANKPTCDSGKVAQSAVRAHEAADKATMLTRQLLAFARRQRLDAEALNINEVILAASRPENLPNGGMSVQTYLAPDLWRCKVDPAHAERALTNLFVNACEALENRLSPWLRAESSNIEIPGTPGVPAWAGLLPGRYVSVAISDNGAGMDEAVRPRAMDPFFSTKGEGQGPGLGLSTVHGFVLQSGGAVRIYSRKDIGTTVRLYFPAVGDSQSEHEQPPAQAPEHAEANLRGTESILIVEDRPEIAQLACEALTRNGYQPTIAHTGDEAWRRIAAGEQYHLIFSDVVMPGTLNGVELARKIEHSHPETRILLTSGYTSEAIECTDTVGLRYPMLSKPYQSVALLSRIRGLLNGV